MLSVVVGGTNTKVIGNVKCTGFIILYDFKWDWESLVLKDKRQKLKT